MATRHLFRHLLYSHAFGCYGAAIVAARIYSGLDLRRFAGCAFPIFISPLVLPLGLMVEDQKHLVVCAAVYGLTFCATLIFLRRRQGRWEIEARSLIAAAQAEPMEVRTLGYYSAAPREVEPYGSIELIAAGSGLIGIIGWGVCGTVGNSRENSGKGPLGPWVMWALLIPSLTAMIAGLVGCFKTKAKTGPRKVAFIGLNVGVVSVALIAYLLYSHLAGLDHYG